MAGPFAYYDFRKLPQRCKPGQHLFQSIFPQDSPCPYCGVELKALLEEARETLLLYGTEHECTMLRLFLNGIV